MRVGSSWIAEAAGQSHSSPFIHRPIGSGIHVLWHDVVDGHDDRVGRAASVVIGDDYGDRVHTVVGIHVAQAERSIGV